jgi:DNA-binding NarL/FixJ family response regulator
MIRSMRVLLVDDHPLILSALRAVIEGMGANFRVECAESAAAARALLSAHDDFDLVLLDLQLGDASGFDVLGEFRTLYPALPVVVISASDLTNDVIRAIDLGAMGFVPKRSGTGLLAQALKLVMEGGIYVPPMSQAAEVAPAKTASNHAAVPSAQAGVQHKLLDQAKAQVSQATVPDLEGLSLTPRQTDVLALLLQGKPNKLIARELGVSVDTVKDHVAAVLKALGVSSRTQAVLAVGQMVQNHPERHFSTWRPG